MNRQGMEFTSKHIDYRFKQTGTTYLVWLKTLNQYLRLEEPACLVFRQFAEGLSEREIIRECMNKYLLPEPEAKRFVSEILERFTLLYRKFRKPANPVVSLDIIPHPFKIHSEKQIAVCDKTVRFTFGDHSLEQFIFPLFSHLQDPRNSENCDLHLEVFKHQGKVYLISNQEKGFEWSTAQAYRLKGSLALTIINLIHHTSEETWMGVIHASSVSLGNRAVMFPARPGGGKSTLAALLMAHGCGLISDDFTPVAMESQYIYPFPGAISLKQGSIPLLESYFPGLKGLPNAPNLSKGKKVSFLAPSLPQNDKVEGYPVSAIVFVQYQKKEECELERIGNLDALNDFLNESWLADRPRAAEQFMDWYLETPCYRLHYGNHQKAVESIQKLFKDVT